MKLLAISPSEPHPSLYYLTKKKKMLNKSICIITLLFFSILATAQTQQITKNVAIFIHEGVELFDFAGPGEVFVAAGRQSPVINFNVYTVAATETQLTSQTFLKIIPNYSIDNCPKPDIIVLPGGATNIPLQNPKVIEWIKQANEQTDITLSVCTGAFLLGKAGLLEGLKATTHWGSINGLRKGYPNTEVLEDTKFVDNGKIVTSGGVSSGTEGSLHVVSRMAGKSTAQKVARYMEYNSWDGRIGLVEKENLFIRTFRKSGIEQAITVAETKPPFYGELSNLAEELLEHVQTKKAIPLIEYMVKKYPFAEGYELLGRAYKKMGKPAPVTEKEVRELLLAGRVSDVMEHLEKTKKQYPHWIMFDEANVNRIGYRFLSQEKLDRAIQVFELNAKAYPNSFNVWDSLAEGHLKAGHKDLAKKYYEKSLILNPENTNATKVLSSLN